MGTSHCIPTAIAFLLFSIIRIASAQAPVYDVKKYGAKGNGKNVDTKAIDKAIDAANAAGGGTKEQPSREVPAIIDSYPDANRFGITPAYGFFIRNVKDLK